MKLLKTQVLDVIVDPVDRFMDDGGIWLLALLVLAAVGISVFLILKFFRKK